MIRVLNRAIFNANCAAGAFILSDIPGFSDQSHLEVTSFTFNVLDLGVCEHFDVWVPADLDQLG